MIKSGLYKFSVGIILSCILCCVNTGTSFAQVDAKSTFELGKVKEQKNPIPGEGSIVGAVVVVGKKAKVPLAFIEVEGARSIQADSKGRFNLVLAEGMYKIKVNCSQYKALIIEQIAVKEGVDQYIKIELAIVEKGDKFK